MQINSPEAGEKKRKRKIAINNENTFVCVCGRIYQSNASWVNHIKLKHPDNIDQTKRNSTKPKKCSTNLGRPPCKEDQSFLQSCEINILTTIECCIYKIFNILKSPEKFNDMIINKSTFPKTQIIKKGQAIIKSLNIDKPIPVKDFSIDNDYWIFKGKLKLNLRYESLKYFSQDIAIKISASFDILLLISDQNKRTQYFQRIWDSKGSQVLSQLEKIEKQWINVVSQKKIVK